MNKRLHLAVEGLVQGVSFRAFVATEARRRHLTGWVRNLFDGRVELAAEGPEPELEALLAACRRGPPAARVEHVDVQWQEARGEYTGFLIRESD